MRVSNNLSHTALIHILILNTAIQVAFTFNSMNRNPFEAILWSFKKANKIDLLRQTSISFRSFSCSGRVDQLYPDLSSGCSSYYRCLGGASYYYKCPNRQLFDNQLRSCRPEREVHCTVVPPTTEKCRHQSDGFYPNYEDACSSYYSCRNGTLEDEGTCEGKGIWDPATGSCGFGMQVACNPPSCEGLDEGYFPLTGSSCSAYYYCRDGNRTDLLCPPGSTFDYMKKTCIYGRNAVCYEGACEERANGLHAFPDAPCNTYYRCFNGALIQLEECPNGKIFNGQRCIYSRNYSCWGEGGGSCENRSDGLYEAEDSDCRGFFYCRNRQVIRNFHCASGLVFNGKACVEDSNFICNTRPQIPDCTYKFDGYYTVKKTKCNRFFRCRAGKKLSEHSCPGSYIFNGSKCVDSSSFSCPSKESDGTPRTIYRIRQRVSN